MTNINERAATAYGNLDLTDAKVTEFLRTWPLETWRDGSTYSAAIATPKTVLFGIRSTDSKAAAALMFGPAEVQYMANALSLAALTSIHLMLDESFSGGSR